MSVLEFALILAASPVIAILVFGAWRFASDTNASQPPSQTSKLTHRIARYRNLKKELAT